MIDVFISYARRNRDQVLAIKKLLDDKGLDVFFDVEGGVDGGDVYTDVVDQKLREAKAVLGCWTPHALTRRWIKIECHIALDQDKLVVAEIERIKQDEVPAVFYQVNREDLTSFANDPNHPAWRRLENTLAKRFTTWAELNTSDPEARAALTKAARLRGDDAPEAPQQSPRPPAANPLFAATPVSAISRARLGLYLQLGGVLLALMGLVLIVYGA